MKLSEILDYIEEQADERELRAILEAYGTGSRRARAARVQKLLDDGLSVGDRIVITPGIKPKYFVGKQGTVVDFPKADMVRVDFGARVSNRYGQMVTVPLSCVKAVK